MTSTFDVTASSFEMYRALPPGAPEAIREAIWKASGRTFKARILDLGAGTGRLGKAFVQAHDAYVGVDLSMAMLREFSSQCRTACLVQASGEQLPFRDGGFEMVLLIQVLSGTENWRQLLLEVYRVLAKRGVIVAGKTVTPAEGVDAQMKRQLSAILDDMGVAFHESKKARKQALAWLESNSSRYTHVCATSWSKERRPREFLRRHRTAARFAALPAAVQEESLRRLATWAEKKFSSLEKAFPEEHSFELEVFEVSN